MLGWQDLVALSVVAAAATYVAVQVWRAIRKKRAGCGHCSSCPSSESSPGPNVVTIGDPAANGHPRRG